MAEGRKSFQSQSQEEESYSQRTQFDSILQNQRHVELLGAVKKLTSSIILLQRSHDELRIFVEKRFDSIHQQIEEQKESTTTPKKVENSPSISDDTERETMTVDDYLRCRKRQRNERYGDSTCEVLMPVAKNITSWTCGGTEGVQSSHSFFDDIFREDQMCTANRNTENRRTSIPFRHPESIRRNSSCSSIRWGSGRVQYRTTNSVTCESAMEYVGDNSSSSGSTGYSAMTDDFSLH